MTVEVMAIATKEREARDDREGESTVDLTNETHDDQGPLTQKKNITLGSILKQTTESRSANRTSLEEKVKKKVNPIYSPQSQMQTRIC